MAKEKNLDISPVAQARTALQHIIFSPREDGRSPLYIKKQKTLESEIWTFDTYFNSFSWRKWKKYAELEDLWLSIEASGVFTLEIFSVNEMAVESLIARVANISGGKWEDKIPLAPPGDCVFIYFRLVWPAGEEPFLAAGAFETTAYRELINTLGVICSYKREEYLEKNAKAICAARKANPILHKHFSLLAIDNASRIEPRDFAAYDVRIIANPNTGGSGGYARGMLEALKMDDLDYIILMDDDVEIEPEAIYRAITFLSFLKEDYRRHFLGAAMFGFENRAIQRYWLESLNYKNFTFIHYAPDIDLSRRENILLTTLWDEFPNSYNAWWFSCIPVRRIREIGLPMPFFVKYDDVEYGIRNGSKVILLNGIGVWHEEFEKKDSKTSKFFEERNRIIYMLLQKPAFLLYLRFLVGMGIRAFKRSLKFDYGFFDSSSRALQSVMRGPADMVNMERLHETRRRLSVYSGTTGMPRQGGGAKRAGGSKAVLSRKLKNILAVLILNGHILPRFCLRKSCETVCEPELSDMLLASQVRLSGNDGSGEKIRRLDYKKFWLGSLNYACIALICVLKYPIICKKYVNAREKFKTVQFWEKFLNLDSTSEAARNFKKA